MGTFINDGAAVLPPVKEDASPPTGEIDEWAAGDANRVREALLDLRTAVLPIQARATMLSNLGIFVSSVPPTSPITYAAWVAGGTGHWMWIEVP